MMKKSLIFLLAPILTLLSPPIIQAAGISAGSTWVGGYFWNSKRSGHAWIATGDHGIEASGNNAGGSFLDADNSGSAQVGTGDYGIRAAGNFAGGTFNDKDSSSFAYVGFSTYKIWGTGNVSFVQNHPEDKDHVIVYSAPEGDEVATYTRGSARLVNGEARIPLGETFKWVTNPDIGLTTHLTPRGQGSVLYAASLSTSELVVKSMAGFPDDIQFDYIVYGLRIGFEDVTVVQKKIEEARIPSMASHRKAIEEQPELARYTALSRWARMGGSDRATVMAGMTDARALVQQIEEFDPKIHKNHAPEQEK
jgi:hypothetical protein